MPRDMRKYFDQGCHCTAGDTKGGCVKQIVVDELEDFALSLRELIRRQLNLVIFGQLQAIISSSLSRNWKNPQ